MTADSSRILVWDWSVRLVHWLMVVLVPLLWWTAEEGYMDWHRGFGLTMLGLVLFRLTWGLIGTWTARFVPMVRRIGTLTLYVRKLRKREQGATFGHSPLAVLSVFALLGALTTQVATGLFSVDVDGLESGPLAVLVSFETGRWLADIHEFNFNLLAGLIGLHIAAIAAYQFVLKEKLAGAMVTGRRSRTDFDAGKLPDNRLRLVRFIAAASLSVVCIVALASFG
ncbi:cytochrome b/b6 domain-containing protein [Parasphingorhabdus sp.]|uniref:cytochrome b/b6 domain-containing protein n=1 Tax=Parasphingorhabdus sp. TaxID=2709688 RepID=UPI003C767E5F